MVIPNKNVIDLAAELLESVVTPLPVVDIHTHIRPSGPAAQDLGEIVFYHYILTALETAGVSRVKLENARTAEEKIALFASEHRLVANTVTYWCLRQVLRDFDIAPEAPLTAGSLTDAGQKVRLTSTSSTWPHKLLVERNNIRKTFLTLNITEELPSFDRKLFAGALRLDDLLADLSPATLQSFETASGSSIGDLNSFERALGARVSAFAQSGGLTITAGMPPEEDYVCSDSPTAARLFEKIRKGDRLESGDRALLHSYVLRSFVSVARDLHLPIQLMLGVRRPLPGNVAIPVLRADLAVRFTGLFHSFPDARFDLILSSVAHSQELIAVAQNYPNVSLAGHWWYAFSPPYIRNVLTERLLALPAVKLHAFFSDAYNVEWSTGKLALLRRELSRVLAELITSGYLSESQAPEIARALLYENPARLYAIGDMD